VIRRRFLKLLGLSPIIAAPPALGLARVSALGTTDRDKMSAVRIMGSSPTSVLPDAINSHADDIDLIMERLKRLEER
jgi:hypothetical protein